jgi:hypothetical protein
MNKSARAVSMPSVAPAKTGQTSSIAMKLFELCDEELAGRAGRRLQLSRAARSSLAHLDDESLAGFAEGGLPDSEAGEVEAHLAACPECRRVALTAHRPPAAADMEGVRVPDQAQARVRQLVSPSLSFSQQFQLVIELVQDAIRILKTNGEIILQTAPAQAVRSKPQSLTEQPVTARKRFEQCEVRVDVSKTPGRACRVIVHAQQLDKREYLPCVRVTLSSRGMVRESSVARGEPVIFDRVAPDNYTLDLEEGSALIGRVDLGLLARPG